MPISHKTRKLMIRYKGVLDLEGLYRVIVQWLKARRYWFHETTYKHKVPSALGAEEQIRFRAERKCNEYYRHDVMVFFHIWDQQQVEVIREGKKQKLINAKVEITLEGTLVCDWQGTFEKTKFTMMLRDFAHAHLIKHQVEDVWYDELQYRMIKMQAMIKDFIDMQAKSHAYEGYLGDTG